MAALASRLNPNNGMTLTLVPQPGGGFALQPVSASALAQMQQQQQPRGPRPTPREERIMDPREYEAIWHESIDVASNQVNYLKMVAKNPGILSEEVELKKAMIAFKIAHSRIEKVINTADILGMLDIEHELKTEAKAAWKSGRVMKTALKATEALEHVHNALLEKIRNKPNDSKAERDTVGLIKQHLGSPFEEYERKYDQAEKRLQMKFFDKVRNEQEFTMTFPSALLDGVPQNVLHDVVDPENPQSDVRKIKIDDATFRAIMSRATVDGTRQTVFEDFQKARLAPGIKLAGSWLNLLAQKARDHPQDPETVKSLFLKGTIYDNVRRLDHLCQQINEQTLPLLRQESARIFDEIDLPDHDGALQPWQFHYALGRYEAKIKERMGVAQAIRVCDWDGFRNALFDVAGKLFGCKLVVAETGDAEDSTFGNLETCRLTEADGTLIGKIYIEHKRQDSPSKLPQPASSFAPIHTPLIAEETVPQILWSISSAPVLSFQSVIIFAGTLGRVVDLLLQAKKSSEMLHADPAGRDEGMQLSESIMRHLAFQPSVMEQMLIPQAKSTDIVSRVGAGMMLTRVHQVRVSTAQFHCWIRAIRSLKPGETANSKLIRSAFANVAHWGTALPFEAIAPQTLLSQAKPWKVLRKGMFDLLGQVVGAQVIPLILPQGTQGTPDHKAVSLYRALIEANPRGEASVTKALHRLLKGDIDVKPFIARFASDIQVIAERESAENALRPIAKQGKSKRSTTGPIDARQQPQIPAKSDDIRAEKLRPLVQKLAARRQAPPLQVQVLDSKAKDSPDLLGPESEKFTEEIEAGIATISVGQRQTHRRNTGPNALTAEPEVADDEKARALRPLVQKIAARREVARRKAES